MAKRSLLAVAAFSVALSGCGGGNKATQRLFVLGSVSKWVYRFTGTVTKGGSTQSVVPTQSTVTVEVTPGPVVTDLNGTPVSRLDRKYSLKLVDTTTYAAIQRAYVSQSRTITNGGIFMHGFNEAGTGVLDPANDKFVPSANGFKFVGYPDPALNGASVSFTDPFAIGAGANYALTLGTVEATVSVPAGSFRAKSVEITEGYLPFTLDNGAFAPNTGVLSGEIDTTLPDGTRIQGTIVLLSATL